MTLQPIKDISKYKRFKLTMRDRFKSEKTGDNTLFEDQSKKFKPLLSSQQEISKTIKDIANRIVGCQNDGYAALQPLLPLLQNMQKALRILPPLPSYVLPSCITPSQYVTPQSAFAELDARSHIPLPVASVSSRIDPIRVNLYEGFDQQDLDNLREKGLQLSSKIYESDTISETQTQVKILNKSLGNQYLGISQASKKISNESKARNKSQRDTLQKYKDRLDQTESANKLLASSGTEKSGRGVPNANKAVLNIP